MGRSESKNKIIMTTLPHYHTMTTLPYYIKVFGKYYMKSRTGLCIAIFFVIYPSVLLTLLSHFLIVWLNILFL